MNGIRGNMAVIVNRNNDSYNAHRIVLPDGKSFRFPDIETDTASERSQGVTQKSSLAKTADTVSESRVSETVLNVKQNYSVDDARILKAIRTMPTP